MWCLAYYIKGCISWTWYYPYNYGPMLIDMVELEEKRSNIVFDLGKSNSKSKSKIDEGLIVFFSILLMSYFMWSVALDSSDVPSSYSIMTLAYHITTYLYLPSFKHITIYLPAGTRQRGRRGVLNFRRSGQETDNRLE